jgi:SMC interacting uncharacterized protein involved in chromosome segregation
MDTLFGVIIIAVAGYFVIKWVMKEEKTLVEETKVEPAKKNDSDFVTGLTVAKVETAIVSETKEAAVEIAKTIEAKVEAVAVKVEEEIKAEVNKVVEEVEVKTVKLEEKTKAIETVVESKTEKLEAAVKKTKAKKKAK